MLLFTVLDWFIVCFCTDSQLRVSKCLESSRKREKLSVNIRVSFMSVFILMISSFHDFYTVIALAMLRYAFCG